MNSKDKTQVLVLARQTRHRLSYLFNLVSRGVPVSHDLYIYSSSHMLSQGLSAGPCRTVELVGPTLIPTTLE